MKRPRPRLDLHHADGAGARHLVVVEAALLLGDRLGERRRDAVVGRHLADVLRADGLRSVGCAPPDDAAGCELGAGSSAGRARAWDAQRRAGQQDAGRVEAVLGRELHATVIPSTAAIPDSVSPGCTTYPPLGPDVAAADTEPPADDEPGMLRCAPACRSPFGSKPFSAAS